MGFFDRWKMKKEEPKQEEGSFIKKTEFPDGMVVQRKADPVVWDWKTMDRVDAKEDDVGISKEVRNILQNIRQTEIPDNMRVKRGAEPKRLTSLPEEEYEELRNGIHNLQEQYKVQNSSVTSEEEQKKEQYKWVAKVARELHQQNKDIDFLGAYDSTREFLALCSFVAESKGLHFDYKKISPSDRQLIDYCRMSDEEREKLKQDYGYSTLEQQSNISR